MNLLSRSATFFTGKEVWTECRKREEREKRGKKLGKKFWGRKEEFKQKRRKNLSLHTLISLLSRRTPSSPGKRAYIPS